MKPKAKPKYEPEFCDKLVSLMSQGLCKTQCAARFKIDVRTINNWIRDIPDFAEAYDLGYTLCYDWWMTKGREKYLEADNDKGYKYWQSMVSNIFGIGPHAAHPQNNITNIQINQTNNNNNKSEQELLEILQGKISQLRMVPNLELLPTLDIKAEAIPNGQERDNPSN